MPKVWTRNILWGGLFLGALGATAQAASVHFTPREVFRVPFSPERQALGARVEGDHFSFPRDFTLDAAGRIYIYDTKKHRVARFSPQGVYEMGFNYPATAERIFAHADVHNNLWLMVTDPTRGLYYGIYDPRGKKLREGIFAQYDTFRLHIEDDYALHLILSSSKNKTRPQMYVFDENNLRMKNENIPPPPPEHHQVHKSDKLYYIDAVPGQANPVSRVTDASRRPVAEMKGSVVYMTAQDDIYTRVGACQIQVYDIVGTLKGQADLTGLPASCESIRFGSNGDIYQLDGIPDAAGKYTPEMTGMRVVVWERQ